MPTPALLGKAALQTSILFSSLQSLNCPLLKDIDEARFADLASQPCEWRQNLILWLLAEMDPTVAQSVTSSVKSSLLTRLHDVLSSLGLCPIQRQDLVTGSARRLDQLAFYLKLLHVVEMIRHQKGSSLSDNAVIDNCVHLMNDGLSQASLDRTFGGPVSYLPPELSLRFRGEVEKRKVAASEKQVEPLLWRVHAWGNDVVSRRKAQTEEMQRLPASEFLTAPECEKQCEVVQKLADSVEQFVGTHRRVLRTACDQRKALANCDEGLSATERQEKDARVAEFGSKFGQLGRKLDAIEVITENVEKIEEEIKRIVIRSQQRNDCAFPRNDLIAEISAFSKELH